MSLSITPSPPLQPVNGLPGEIIQSIVDCSAEDSRTLGICSLISRTWLPFSRYRLFRNTICHITHPSSLDDFLTFFHTSSDIVPYVRSLKLVGSPCEPHATLVIEDLRRVLEKFFQLKRLAMERLRLSSRTNPVLDGDSKLQVLANPSVALAELRLCRISCDDATAGAFNELTNWVGSSSPSYCLSIADPSDVKTFQTFVDSFGPQIKRLSLNTLGYFVPLRLWLTGYSEDDADSLGEREFMSLAPCTSLTELVFYITSAGGLDDDSQFLFYWATLQATATAVASFESQSDTPPDTLRRVTLRFQRCGPHTTRTMRAHTALRDPPHPHGWMDISPELWKILENALLSLPALDTLVCVLCDGGFVDEWRTFLSDTDVDRALAIVSEDGDDAGDRQEGPLDEYDDYVALLTKAFPRLHSKGLLRFERGDRIL